MTKEETQKLMQMLAAVYPQFYKSKNGREKQVALEVWAVAMAPYPFGFIAAGIQRLVQQNTFAPSAAEVISAAKAAALGELEASQFLRMGVEMESGVWVLQKIGAIPYEAFCERQKARLPQSANGTPRLTKQENEEVPR